MNSTNSDISLPDSAKDFLIEALLDYKSEKLNFAIVHAMIAVELMLKERLRRIHPTLIFEKVDAKKLDGARTVSMGNILKRLTDFDVHFAQDDKDLIDLLREWRNDVVHHMATYDSKTARGKLERLLDFLISFSRRELHLSLQDLIPSELFEIMRDILTTWKLDVEKAQIEAGKTDVITSPCPNCGVKNVLSINHQDEVTCHLCGANQYCFFWCNRCGSETVAKSFGEHVCDDCYSDEATSSFVDCCVEIDQMKRHNTKK